jgi:phosphoribosylformimino-5-aminoimidazole carboxamide ribotide isomerase
VAADPLETARGFEACGAELIHIVDLDGALKGERVNGAIIREIVEKTPSR